MVMLASSRRRTLCGASCAGNGELSGVRPLASNVRYSGSALTPSRPADASAWRRQLIHATGEIGQVVAHLVEGEAEREHVLDSVGRQLAGETFVAQRGHLRGVAVERGQDGIHGGRAASLLQRAGARLEIGGR